MAALTNAGYQSIRDFIQANWLYIEVRDTSGAAIVRLPESDPRVSWIHSAGANPLRLQVVLTGSDADVPVPVTVRSTAIFSVASGGSSLSTETLVEGDATLNADPDNVTITHNLEIPDIP